MSFFADFLANNVPWDTKRIRIFEFVENHWRDEEKVLPDEEQFFQGNPRWASGALDGVFVYHSGDVENEGIVEAFFSAFEQLVSLPNQQNLIAFYQLFFQDYNVIGFVDALMERVIHEFLIPNQNSGNEVYVYNAFLLGQWLALFSPDREPVKFGMAILGLFPDVEETRDVIITLGFHDEFTLFALVGMGNIFKNPEQEFWVLAQVVKGWGRIHCVERLAGVESAEIKKWLVREGYKNEVLYEYLAFICATTGDLHGELKKANPDAEVMEAAGEILSALIRGGVVEGMKEYEDGAKTTYLFIRHLSRREATLEQFIIVQEICNYIRDHNEWDKPTSAMILETAQTILNRPDWANRALQTILSKDDFLFHTACQILRYLNIDPWEFHFERQMRGEGDEWNALMQTNDPAKIDRVLDLAMQNLPLVEIATGVGDDMGLGPKFALYQALDSILQGLSRFPKRGWNFIQAGLQSPVVRIRDLSVSALGTWGKENWHEDVGAALQNLSRIEPNKEIQEKIRQLLAI